MAKVWTEKDSEYLKAHFRNTDNETLALDLGCGERTIRRKARALGLKKSKSYISMACAEGYGMMKYNHWKRTGEKYDPTKHQCLFTKGHKFPPEVEAKRMANLRAALKKRKGLKASASGRV